AAVDAPDPAGPHERDSGEPRGRERASHRRRSELAARHAGGEIAGAGLARVCPGVSEALELPGVEPDHDLALEHTDRRGHGPFGHDRGLGGPTHLHPHPGGEPVCHERSLERDDRAALVEGLLHFGGDPQHFRHEGTAPSAPTQRAAASSPSSIPPTRKPAARASPAPVVSTTSASSGANSSTPSADRTSTPREPRFTTVVFASA